MQWLKTMLYYLLWLWGLTGPSWEILTLGLLCGCSEMSVRPSVIWRLNWGGCPQWLTHMPGRGPTCGVPTCLGLHTAWQLLPWGRKQKLPGHVGATPGTGTLSLLPYSISQSRYRVYPDSRGRKNKCYCLMGAWQSHAAEEHVGEEILVQPF